LNFSVGAGVQCAVGSVSVLGNGEVTRQLNSDENAIDRNIWRADCELRGPGCILCLGGEVERELRERFEW
jgi:hypothetical protein